MSDEFRDRLFSLMSVYIQGDKLEAAKMQIDILCNDFDISKSEHEIVPYEGDINDLIVKKFICAKIAKGCSQRTVKYYADTVRQFFQKVGKIYNDVTPDDVRVYLAVRVYRDHISKTTANNERRNISSFYTWLQKEEILLKNPMSKIEVIKATKEKKKAFTLMELEKIRDACKTTRERAIIEMLISTWCRVSELINIKTKDILDGKCLVKGKGDKYREVYLNARAVVAVKNYLAERNDANPYLFAGGKSGVDNRKALSEKNAWWKDPDLVSPDRPLDAGSVESICRRLGRRAGVDKVHPHRFRRTGATMALRQGMPIIQVSKLLGHESIETTQIYLDITDEELEMAHEKYVV